MCLLGRTQRWHSRLSISQKLLNRLNSFLRGSSKFPQKSLRSGWPPKKKIASIANISLHIIRRIQIAQFVSLQKCLLPVIIVLPTVKTGKQEKSEKNVMQISVSVGQLGKARVKEIFWPSWTNAVDCFMRSHCSEKYQNLYMKLCSEFIVT